MRRSRRRVLTMTGMRVRVRSAIVQSSVTVDVHDPKPELPTAAFRLLFLTIPDYLEWKVAVSFEQLDRRVEFCCHPIRATEQD